MRNTFLFVVVLLLVDGVFGVDETVTVTLVKGDSVTLNPHTEIKGDDSAHWKFNDTIIAQKTTVGLFSTSEGVDERFKCCLNLDKQTGSLTITNIRTDHAGLYKLQIRGTTAETFKIFNVTVTGKITTVSVKEGDPIILHTGLILDINDLIMWMFNDQLIPEINKGTNGRLYLDRPSGSLIITKSSITDSGDYHLHMNSSTYTLERNISVTVSDPGLSSGAVTGTVVGVLLVFAAAGVIYHRWKVSKLQRRLDA